MANQQTMDQYLKFQIKNAKANIEEINPSIDTRIQELQNNIATWKNEITQLQKTTNV